MLACIMLTVVGGSQFLSSSDGLLFGTLCARLPLCAMVCTGSSGLSEWSNAYRDKSSSSALSSLPDVSNCDSESAAWCFTSPRCTRSKLNPESLKRHQASRSMESVRLRIHLRASWLVCNVKRFLLRYGQRQSTDHTTAKNLRCVVSYSYSVSVNERYQYPIGFVILCGRSCRRTQPTCTLHASVSNDKCLPEYGCSSTGGAMRAALEVSIASSSLLFRDIKVAGWSYFKR